MTLRRFSAIVLPGSGASVRGAAASGAKPSGAPAMGGTREGPKRRRRAGRRTADRLAVAVAVEYEVCCAEGFDHVALLVAVGDGKAERVAAHWHPLRSVTRQRPGQPEAVSGGCAGSTGFQWPGDAAEVFGLKGSGIRDKPGGTVEKLEEWLRARFAQLAFACGCHNDAIRIFRRVGLCRSPDRLHAISGQPRRSCECFSDVRVFACDPHEAQPG